MKCNKAEAIARVVKKAGQSSCRFRVGAIGFDHRGKVIGVKYNSPRFHKRGGGQHAEQALMASSPKSLRTILIVRIGNGGALRPIHACNACQSKADELGITIRTVEEK